MTTPEPSYDPNIPQPQDDLAISQQDILENFQEMTAKFGINHIPMGLRLPDEGKHSKAEIVQKTKGTATSLSQVNLFTKPNSQNGAQLFYTPAGTISEIALTNYQNYDISTDGSRYFTFLPGGFIVYFGFIDIQANSLPFTLELNPICKTIDMAISNPVSPTPSSGQNANFIKTSSKLIDNVSYETNIIFIPEIPASKPVGAAKFFYLAIGKL